MFSNNDEKTFDQADEERLIEADETSDAGQERKKVHAGMNANKIFFNKIDRTKTVAFGKTAHQNKSTRKKEGAHQNKLTRKNESNISKNPANQPTSRKNASPKRNNDIPSKMGVFSYRSNEAQNEEIKKRRTFDQADEKCLTEDFFERWGIKEEIIESSLTTLLATQTNTDIKILSTQELCEKIENLSPKELCKKIREHEYQYPTSEEDRSQVDKILKSKFHFKFRSIESGNESIHKREGETLFNWLGSLTDEQAKLIFKTIIDNHYESPGTGKRFIFLYEMKEGDDVQNRKYISTKVQYRITQKRPHETITNNNEECRSNEAQKSGTSECLSQIERKFLS